MKKKGNVMLAFLDIAWLISSIFAISILAVIALVNIHVPKLRFTYIHFSNEKQIWGMTALVVVTWVAAIFVGFQAMFNTGSGFLGGLAMDVVGLIAWAVSLYIIRNFLRIPDPRKV